MFQEYDVVKSKDIKPCEQLGQNCQGTILNAVSRDPDAFAVEFVGNYVSESTLLDLKAHEIVLVKTASEMENKANSKIAV